MIYLGVDWGLKRIGLAISSGMIASPLSTLNIQGLTDGITKVIEVAKKEQAETIVMGKPEGEMGKMVDKAFQALQDAGAKIILTDETLSTQKAKEVMIEMGLGKKARQDDNAVAAAIILQEFLDEKDEK